MTQAHHPNLTNETVSNQDDNANLNQDSLIKEQRTNMILRQVRPWFVHDENILNLLYFLPREDFFSDEVKKFAFVDMEVPLTEGRMTHPPKLEGKILSFLGLDGTQSVLEFGTINGYLSALMSKIAKEVISFESDDRLYQQSKERLKDYSNVQVFKSEFKDLNHHREVSGREFDVIVYNQPISDLLPEHLNALADDGKLFCFEGEASYIRAMVVKFKDANRDEIEKTPVFEFNLKSTIIRTKAKSFDF